MVNVRIGKNGQIVFKIVDRIQQFKILFLYA